jgi:hypothetical protein
MAWGIECHAGVEEMNGMAGNYGLYNQATRLELHVLRTASDHNRRLSFLRRKLSK